VSTAERYVAAAYVVFLLATLTWLVIITSKLSRLEREVGELVELARERLG
jgi:hypothetical protein